MTEFAAGTAGTSLIGDTGTGVGTGSVLVEGGGGGELFIDGDGTWGGGGGGGGIVVLDALGTGGSVSVVVLGGIAGGVAGGWVVPVAPVCTSAPSDFPLPKPWSSPSSVVVVV